MTNSGLLNIDKPAGITSHDVVQRVRRISGIRRVGHAGTLDPLATGVLLVCVGRATRLIEYVMGRPKTYVATLRLGQTTDTFDAEGAIVDERPVAVDEGAIQAALPAFRGEIEQYAPAFSAVKREGVPLYRLARQGVEVERPLRHVTIYALDVVNWQTPFLTLRVACSTGTYVRSLAHDLGQTLGCGAHITALRRTAIGQFQVEDAVTLEALAEGWETHLMPPETAVAHLPRVEFSADHARLLQNGQRLPLTVGQPSAPLARAYAPDGEFLGIVGVEDHLWQPRKMFPALD